MLKKPAIAIALIAVASAAQAQSVSSFYAGADIGTSRLFGTDGVRKTSKGVFAGYQFNDFVGAEIGYTRYASDFSHTTVSALFSVPVDQFRPYIRLGQSYQKLKGVSGEDGRMGAVGVNYQYNKQVGVRFEIARPQSEFQNVNAAVHYSF